MFTLEMINNERIKFINYTNFEIPRITKVSYEESDAVELAYILSEEIDQDGCIIHVCGKMHNNPVKYQFASIWHEFTHIFDCILLKDNDNSLAIMQTYSEARAKSVELKYLMDCPSNLFNVDFDNKVIITPNGEQTIAKWINEDLLDCKLSFRMYDLCRDINSFNRAIYYFCHYCGYLLLRKRNDANNLLNKQLFLFPDKYKEDLKYLAKSILNDNKDKCGEVYINMLLKVKSETSN